MSVYVQKGQKQHPEHSLGEYLTESMLGRPFGHRFSRFWHHLSTAPRITAFRPGRAYSPGSSTGAPTPFGLGEGYPYGGPYPQRRCSGQFAIKTRTLWARRPPGLL